MALVPASARIAAAFLMAAGCSARAALAQSPVSRYETGRRRELELTAAALGLIVCAPSADQRSVAAGAAASDHIESDAAREADLRVSDYRLLVSRVDSQLLATPPHPPVRDLTPALARRLDSLRVALVVARARLSTEARQPFHHRAASCP
jgi:hypothetical protein